MNLNIFLNKFAHLELNHLSKGEKFVKIRKWAHRSTLICLFILLTGCTEGKEERLSQVQPPVEQHNIQGTVTQVQGDTITVEEDPNEQTVSTHASIKLTKKTKYYLKKETGNFRYVPGKRKEIVKGSRVAVWFTPLGENALPIEEIADHIVIEIAKE